VVALWGLRFVGRMGFVAGLKKKNNNNNNNNN